MKQFKLVFQKDKTLTIVLIVIINEVCLHESIDHLTSIQKLPFTVSYNVCSECLIRTELGQPLKSYCIEGENK